MKRLLSVGLTAAALSLLLSACGQLRDPVPRALSVTAGTALERSIYLPFQGSWEVHDAPAWLKVSPPSGRGHIRLRLQLTRPALAEVPQLSGQFRLHWKQGPQGGDTTVSVTADMFRVKGRVAAEVKAHPDAEAMTTRKAAAPPPPRGVIVKYKSAAGLLRAQTLGARIQNQGKRLAVLSVPDVSAALKQLRLDPGVEYAAANVVLSTQQSEALLPQDHYAPLQWTYPLIGYGAVWRDMQNSPYKKRVTVAVLDTGVRFDHPDLQGALWGPGEGALDLVPRPLNGSGDLYGLDEDPTDPSTPGRTGGSHGTHVSGVIAARWGKFTPPCLECSDSGVVGATFTAPVRILPVRILDAAGNGDLATIAEGVRYAAGLPVTMNGRQYVTPNKAQVINLSLGGAIAASEAAPLCEAVEDARQAGALVVAAGGNNEDSALFYPAACTGAVGVGSVSLSRSLPERAYYSNFNASIDLAAPGGDDRRALNGGVLGNDAFPDAVFSTSWNYQDDRPNYEGMVGTSQAAPQVSALAALLLSKGGATSPAEVLSRLQQTATDLGPAGRDDATGAGLINAAAALNAPAVSMPLSVQARRETGSDAQSVTLRVDALGRFQGLLREGSYTLLVRRDATASGQAGGRSETTFSLSPQLPEVDLGQLTLQEP